MDRVEKLVKKKAGYKDYIPPFLVIAAMTVFMLFGIPLIPGLILVKFLVLIGLAYLSVFLYRRSNLEYDYCFYQGELDVDKVFNKSSRKTYDSFKIGSAEIAAPYLSERLEPYRDLKKIDVSSSDASDPGYGIVLNHKGSRIMLVIQTDEKLSEAIYRTIPSKYFRD